MNWDWNDFKALGVAVLYAMAAVFGLVGGCAVGIQEVVRGARRAAFVFAYATIGAVAGVGFMAVTSIFNIWAATTIHQHILYSMIVGGAVALTVFSANASVKVIFQRLGIEVQFTTRRTDEERRKEI